MGRPRRQAKLLQAMMAAMAAPTVAGVTSWGSTNPVPIVAATAVPESAPAVLSTTAMSTAAPGERTRVETTVAMAFGASVAPLTNSAARIRARTPTIRGRDSPASRQGQRPPGPRGVCAGGAVRRPVQPRRARPAARPAAIRAVARAGEEPGPPPARATCRQERACPVEEPGRQQERADAGLRRHGERLVSGRDPPSEHRGQRRRHRHRDQGGREERAAHRLPPADALDRALPIHRGPP